MPAAFIEKAGMELVGAFVKTVGLEAGKRVINGKPQKPKENHLTEIKVPYFIHNAKWSD